MPSLLLVSNCGHILKVFPQLRVGKDGDFWWLYSIRHEFLCKIVPYFSDINIDCAHFPAAISSQPK